MEVFHRSIEINFAHRIIGDETNESKIHGHTYLVEVSFEVSPNVDDVSFLENTVAKEITDYCDHSFIGYINDNPILRMFMPDEFEGLLADWWSKLRNEFDQFNSVLAKGAVGTKFYVVDFPPTEENLAKHWHDRVNTEVMKQSNNLAELTEITIWKQDSSSVIYPAE